MNNHMITNLTGSDGYFTFNFFCESIVSSLHTVIHLMEDEQITAPEKLSELPGLLAKIGEDLTQGYEKQKIDMVHKTTDSSKMFTNSCKSQQKKGED